MGDLATLAKARMELEELYLGIPDESVNLTFQDLAELTQNVKPSEKKKPATTMEPISEAKTPRKGSPLAKIPSLDFSKGLQQASNQDHHHHDDVYRSGPDRQSHHMDIHATRGHDRYVEESHRNHAINPNDHRSGGFRHAVEGRRSNIAYDDVSGMSSMASMYGQERGGRRRPGIPHSNICTVCTTYIYIFRHRCLVCGRAYCRQCVNMGMGEMTEGRKCIECLGRRFSQRYIQRAGKMGFCWRYPSMVKLAELKWAEKGPRRSGERAYCHGRSGMMSSRSRSPMTPRAHVGGSTPPSFAMSSPFSPYGTPTHHHLPF